MHPSNVALSVEMTNSIPWSTGTRSPFVMITFQWPNVIEVRKIIKKTCANFQDFILPRVQSSHFAIDPDERTSMIVQCHESHVSKTWRVCSAEIVIQGKRLLLSCPSSPSRISSAMKSSIIHIKNTGLLAFFGLFLIFVTVVLPGQATSLSPVRVFWLYFWAFWHLRCRWPIKLPIICYLLSPKHE